MPCISTHHAVDYSFAQPHETTHPVFPEESHKPVKPDPDTPSTDRAG